MQLLSDFFQTLPHFCLFTTLHPLIVHLPVTLIPFALFLFIFSIVLKKHDFKIITNITLALGLFGAILATFLIHPHDLVLSDKTEEILNMHDYFAYLTLIFSILSSISLIIHFKFIKFLKIRVKFYIPLILITLSKLSVGITGHYGASLSHVYDIKYEKTDHC